MSDHHDQATAMNRRTLLGAAAAASGLAASPDQQRPLVERAKAWLAVDAEARRLMLRWGRLESRAARSMDWFNLTDEARATTAFGVEMARIDDRLSLLFERRGAEFEAVECLRAQDLVGVTAKLAVASRFLVDEDSPAAKIVAGALSDLAGLHPAADPVNFGI